MHSHYDSDTRSEISAPVNQKTKNKKNIKKNCWNSFRSNVLLLFKTFIRNFKNQNIEAKRETLTEIAIIMLTVASDFFIMLCVIALINIGNWIYQCKVAPLTITYIDITKFFVLFCVKYCYVY